MLRPPIKSLLDIGCGSGIWTAAVAKGLPDIDVTGVDLTPPHNWFELANLTFETANVEEEWEFAGNQTQLYDLITIRVLVSAIHDWPSLLGRCFQFLKPGGWIEIPDVIIGTFFDCFDWRDESSPLMRWYQCYRQGASAEGINGFASKERKQCLAHAHFTQVTEKFFRCYLDEAAVTNHKDKQIADLTRQNMFGLLDAVTNAMQKRGQWDIIGATDSELQNLKEAARCDIEQHAASRRYYWT